MIQLHNMKLNTDTNDKRKFVIGLQQNEKIVFLAAKNETEYDEWLKALQAGLLLPPTPPPNRSVKPKKTKVTAQLVDTATSLPQVRKMIKDLVPDDTFNVMAALKRFISQADSQEQAEALEIIGTQVICQSCH